jgi:hypothetical protein
MKVKQNIGIVNALIRITCGLAMLSWTTARLSKKQNRYTYVIMAIMAAMKVGEGIVRYCPLTDLYEKNKAQMSGQEKEMKQEVYGQKQNEE